MRINIIYAITKNNEMKKWIKITLWSSGSIITLLLIGFLILIWPFLPIQNSLDNRNPARKAEMTEITLKWGRLAPFPENVENFTIYTTGSPFTRTFKGSFTATEDIIKSWIAQSPGLQDAKIESISETKKKYIITPGGGANYAEVVIDYEIGKIEFRVSWS